MQLTNILYSATLLLALAAAVPSPIEARAAADSLIEPALAREIDARSPEPAKKGHFGGPDGSKREAAPEPARKGHFGGPDGSKREAAPEPARKGHFGGPDGSKREAASEPAKKGHFGAPEN